VLGQGPLQGSLFAFSVWIVVFIFVLLWVNRPSCPQELHTHIERGFFFSSLVTVSTHCIECL
jgi:hypothetical protein